MRIEHVSKFNLESEAGYIAKKQEINNSGQQLPAYIRVSQIALW